MLKEVVFRLDSKRLVAGSAQELFASSFKTEEILTLFGFISTTFLDYFGVSSSFLLWRRWYWPAHSPLGTGHSTSQRIFQPIL